MITYPNEMIHMILDGSLVRLENTDRMLTCHKAEQCEGEVCSLHNRSDHAMRSYPQNWRSDRAIMERVCPHGVGHPDPDCLYASKDLTHGCCGCCVIEGEL